MKAKHPGPRPLAAVLGTDATLGEWAGRRQREAEWTLAVRRHLPRAIGERLHVAGIEDRTLVVVVGAGAIAAALKTRTPDLLAALRRSGCDVTALRIRVRVENPVAPIPAAAARRLDAAAAAPLFDLASRLADSPLKRSLARWSRRARGR